MKHAYNCWLQRLNSFKHHTGGPPACFNILEQN
jgi:hypothetical protein